MIGTKPNFTELSRLLSSPLGKEFYTTQEVALLGVCVCVTFTLIPYKLWTWLSRDHAANDVLPQIHAMSLEPDRSLTYLQPPLGPVSKTRGLKERRSFGGGCFLPCHALPTQPGPPRLPCPPAPLCDKRDPSKTCLYGLAGSCITRFRNGRLAGSRQQNGAPSQVPQGTGRGDNGHPRPATGSHSIQRHNCRCGKRKVFL